MGFVRARLVLGASLLAALAAIIVALIVGSTSSADQATPRSGGAGTAVAVQSLSTTTSQTLQDPDGSFHATVSAGPLNARNEAGGFSPVDPRLTQDAEGDLKTTVAATAVELPGTFDEPAKVSDAGRWVSFALEDASAAVADATGARASYDDVLRSVDATYETVPSGVKETLKLTAAGAPSTYRFAVSASRGLVPALREDGSVAFADAGHQVRFVLPAATVQAAGDDAPTTDHVSYRLSDDRRTLSVVVDPRWLAEARFPVLVDPSVYAGAAIGCQLVHQRSPADCYAATLLVGESSVEYRAAVRFPDIAPSLPAGATITGAALQLHVQTDGPVPTISVAGLSTPLGEGATWYESDYDAEWTEPGGDPVTSPAPTSLTVGASDVGHWVSADVTALAQSWYANATTNHGVLLSVPDADNTAINTAEFDGVLSSDPPRLQITYTIASTPVNTGAPAITGTPRQGQTLTATPGTWTGSPSYGYQWQACTSATACTAISGATASTYAVTSAEVGKTIKVVVTATAGGSSATATSVATAVVAATAAPASTAIPVITGAAAEGIRLSASDGTWSGTDPITYTYQWRRCPAPGYACVDVADATTAIYDLTPDDIGAKVAVVVTATNAGGAATATSALTGAVVAVAPSVTLPPSVDGVAMDGVSLVTDGGFWSGTAPIATGLQWRRCDSLGATCTDIAGATTDHYEAGPADVGHTLRVAATASNVVTTTVSTSMPSDVVAASAPNSASAPRISGTAANGSELTAGHEGWAGTAPLTYTYQWEQCDASGDGCTTIPGATDATLTLTADLIGSTIRVVETASNLGGSATATSDATSEVKVSLPRRPTLALIAGVAADGITLTAPAGDFGPGAQVTYQWQRCDGVGQNCADVGGATSATYDLGAPDVGTRLRVIETGTTDAGSHGVLSALTDLVAATPLADSTTPGWTQGPGLTGAIGNATANGTAVSGAPRVSYAGADGKLSLLSWNSWSGWVENGTPVPAAPAMRSGSSTWTMPTPSGGLRVYWVATDGALHETLYDSGAWTDSVPFAGAQVAPGSDLSGYLYLNYRWPKVYYARATDHSLCELTFTVSTWSNACFPVKVANNTSPRAIAPTLAGGQVYYVNADDGMIHAYVYTQGAWSDSGPLTGSVALNTSPSATSTSDGLSHIAYVGASDQRIHELSQSSSSTWTTTGALSSVVWPGTSPAATRLPFGGARIYYQVAHHHSIRELSYDTSWHETADLTWPLDPASSPAVVVAGDGQPHVLYKTADDHALHELSYGQGAGWGIGANGSEAIAASSTPTAALTAGGLPRAYYTASADAKLHELAYTSSNGWAQSGALAPATAPTTKAGTTASVVALPDGGMRVYAVGADDLIREFARSSSSGTWTVSTVSSATVAAGSSPSAFLRSDGGLRVYFVNAADNRLAELSRSATATSWTLSTARVPTTIAAGTTPSAVGYGDGSARVYYVRSADRAIGEALYVGAWSDSTPNANAKVAAGSSPSASVNTFYDPRVYYVDSVTKRLRQLSESGGSAWSVSGDLSRPVAPSTSPTSFSDIYSYPRVFYSEDAPGTTSDRTLHEVMWDGSWHDGPSISLAVAAGSSPSAVRANRGGIRLYYVNAASGMLQEVAYDGGPGWAGRVVDAFFGASTDQNARAYLRNLSTPDRDEVEAAIRARLGDGNLIRNIDDNRVYLYSGNWIRYISAPVASAAGIPVTSALRVTSRTLSGMSTGNDVGTTDWECGDAPEHQINTSAEIACVVVRVNASATDAQAFDFLNGVDPGYRAGVERGLATSLSDGDVVRAIDTSPAVYMNYAYGQWRQVLNPAAVGFNTARAKRVTTGGVNLSGYSWGPVIGNYATSWNWGGPNRLIDTDAEWLAYGNQAAILPLNVMQDWLNMMDPIDRANALPADTACYQAVGGNATAYADVCTVNESGEVGDGTVVQRANYHTAFSAKELAVCASYGWMCKTWYGDRQEATAMAESLWTAKDNQSDSTQENAFKHGLWNALMTKSAWGHSDYDAMAAAANMATVHENEMYNRLDKYGRASRMDMVNNARGRGVAQVHHAESERSLCQRMMGEAMNGHKIDPAADPYARSYGTLIWRALRAVDGPKTLIAPTGNPCTI